MRRLLFAPADPQNCKALKESLGCRQEQWKTEVVLGEEEVLRELERNNQWDCLVADLNCESGKSLLSKSRARFPEVVRIGIMGPASLRFPPPAFVHQTISSPLDIKELEVALERSCRLRDLLKGERICQTVGELGELPAAPAVYGELVEKLNHPDTSVSEIAEIIERDVATSAKLLQVVNSIIFRTAHEIVTVRMAASFLGLDVIKNIFLSLEAFQAFEKMPAIPGFSVDELQIHCRLTAAIAGQMQLSSDVRDAAIVASLLHDIGKLVIAYKMPDRFARLLTRSRSKKQPLYRIEEELWGITHAEVGAYLLGLWGLPIRVTEAIAYHHAPQSVPSQRFDTLAAVYVANLLAHEQDGSASFQQLNMEILESLGVAGELSGWRTMAERVASAQQGLQLARSK